MISSVPMPLRIDLTAHPDHTVLALAGDLDAAGAGRLALHIQTLIAAGTPRIVLDTRALRQVSALALVTLADQRRAAEAAGIPLVPAQTPPLIWAALPTGGPAELLVHHTLEGATKGEPGHQV